ncbi:hypothetical protein ACE2AJ_01865 [Aquihabitans daechungensis]|uniref:hypothetical protein n=1 Tax=Aquihabitans daechungensis TaxID=1052257 RepID=UPI003B9E6E24
MSRRIDIELTSDRADGTWSWRAAGAKQPKGVLRAELLPEGAAVGQELRADIEFSLDGTEVVAVLPPKAKNRAAVETLEIIARPVKDDELVTSKLAGRGGRDRGDRGDRGDRRDRGPRRDGDRKPRGDGRGRPDGDRRPRSDGDRKARSEGDRGPRPDRPRRDRPAPPPKPKAKRLRAGRVHRKAALDALPAAEQVIAEQVLNGGIPAVRQAIEKMNEQAKASGGKEVAAHPLIAIAEKLLPDLRAAEWRDKAEAALADLAELDLRDLRSVVVAADTGAKDEESRELASQLREGLTARLDSEQAAWLSELQETLAEGRVVRALRLSSRPPKAGAPLPAELATKLADAAAAALTSDTLPDRWATVLDALSFSPVRLTVAPASKPDAPSEELVAVITRMADRVPKVAEAFGIDPSSAPSRKGRGRGGPGGPKGGKPRPPKPPKPPKPAKPAGDVALAAETPVEDATPHEVAEAVAGDDVPVEVIEAAVQEAEIEAVETPIAEEATASQPAPAPQPDASADPVEVPEVVTTAETEPDQVTDPSPASEPPAGDEPDATA